MAPMAKAAVEELSRDELRRIEVLLMFDEIADAQRSRVAIAIYGRHVRELAQARGRYAEVKQFEPDRHTAMLERSKRNTMARYHALTPEQRKAFHREQHQQIKANPERLAKRRATVKRAQDAYRARQKARVA